MTTDVHTIAKDASLQEAIEIVEKYGVKRLPVLEGKQLVGIVTRANLMHALARARTRGDARGKAGRDIRQSIIAEMDNQTARRLQLAPKSIDRTRYDRGISP